MKKTVSFLLMMTMLLTAFNVTAFANVRLSDISTHWAKADVERSVQLGFINGYEDGTFRPDNTITRAEFVSALIRALKISATKDTSVFVDDNNWAEKSIQAAIENELILTNEYDDLKFQPSKNITRQEIAVMLVRAMDKAKEAEDKGFLAKLFSRFTDLTQVDEQFRGYVKIATDLGIINGYGDGSFGPNRTATRAEAVVMVLRTLEKKQTKVATDRFGRAIRTANLPSNYKDYPYILASVPNEMYEMKYPMSFPGSEVSAELYTQKEFTPENVDLWMERIKKHYDLVLNVDYRTIDENWEKEIFDTISLGLNEDVLKKELKAYREWVQDNQIIIEGQLEPEPTMIYHNGRGRFFVRSQVQFKIVSFKKNENLLWDDRAQYQTLKKGLVYKGYTDVAIATNNGGYWGPTLKVSKSSSLFVNNNFTK